MKYPLAAALASASLASLSFSQDVDKKPSDKKPPPPAAPAETGKENDGAKHVDAAGAKKLLDEPAKSKEGTVTVLDLRTPEEFAEGHLRGATNIDFRSRTFADQISKLDRHKTYLVHCGGGGRSTASLKVFKMHGFKAIVHLDGGLTAWQKAGNPVVK